MNFPAASDRQDLVGYRTNEEWQDLMAQAGAMLETLDDIEDTETKAKVFGAMAGIDALHREALHRLVRLFKEGVLEQVVTDPAINTLMGMYDLLPPEESACQKIWDFLPEDAPGLGTNGEVATSPAGDPAHWSPAPMETDLTEGAAYICQMDEGAVLVARVEGRDLALQAICAHHGAEMTEGRIDGVSWNCPHGPGCSYDLRNGARLGGGVGLQCFNTKTDAQGRLMIGFGMPFEPNMPSF